MRKEEGERHGISNRTRQFLSIFSSSSTMASPRVSIPAPHPLRRFSVFVLLLLLYVRLSAGTAAVFSPAVSPLAPPPPPPPEKPTIYDVLNDYGLPPGIFPSTVVSYELSDSGSLAVSLASDCYVDRFEYPTFFASEVTAVLGYGVLDKVTGIQVRRFLFWFRVDRFKVDLPPPSQFVYIDVGWITRKLPLADFLSVHDCSKSKKCHLAAAGDVFSTWLQDNWALFLQ